MKPSYKTPEQKKADRKAMSKEIRAEMSKGKFAKQAVTAVLAKRKKK